MLVVHLAPVDGRLCVWAEDSTLPPQHELASDLDSVFNGHSAADTEHPRVEATTSTAPNRRGDEPTDTIREGIETFSERGREIREWDEPLGRLL